VALLAGAEEQCAAWTFLTPSDAWQDSYFDASNHVKSAELNFWLSA
jgi:hypothetical protein